MAQQIQTRRDTAANWTSANPVLASGEAGYDTTNNQVRYGNGTDTWSALTPIAGSGSGSVATDAIFDAKGDLAVGTGANTAAKLTAGTNGYVLTADSAEATGLKWAVASGSTAAADITITDTGALFEATQVEAALAELADGSILDNRYVQSSTAMSIVVLTQAQYDALTPVGTTLYVVIG